MHGRGWEGAAPESDAVDRASVPRLFFFFFSDSRRLGSIRAESASIRAESACFGRFRPVSAISVHIGWRPIRPKQAEIGRNMPKSALKLAGEAEFLTSDAFLALFFLCFVNQVY